MRTILNTIIYLLLRRRAVQEYLNYKNAIKR